jgi:hypothetical protein
MPYRLFQSPDEKRFEKLYENKEFRQDLRKLQGVISRVGTLSERQRDKFCEKWAIPRASRFPPSFPTKVKPLHFINTYYEFFRRSHAKVPKPEPDEKNPKELVQYTAAELSELCHGRPIELKTLVEFNSLVGQDFIPEMTYRFLSSRNQGSNRRQVKTSQRKRTVKGHFRKKTSHYIRNVPFKLEKNLYPNKTWAQPSIHDSNLLQIARRLYLIQAAWIILRGEWEHRDENAYGMMSVQKFLQSTYQYLEDILGYKWRGIDNIYSLISKQRFSIYAMSLASLSIYLHRNGIGTASGKRLSVASLKAQLSPVGYAKASPPAWLTRLEADDLPSEMRGVTPPFEGKGKLSQSELTEIFEEVDRRLY